MVELNELARLAGFFDADGSVGVYVTARSRTNFALRVVVSGIHSESIRRYRVAFGGVAKLQATRHGMEKRPIWTWYTTSNKAQVALRAMLPFLVVKREQAEEALRISFRKYDDPSRNLISDEERRLRAEVSQNIKRMKREVA